MLAGLRKLAKGALWDAKGTLSLSRCFLLFVAVEVTAITWLVVAWCWYITKNGLLVDAAPFASSVSTGAAAVLSSQVAAAAWQYFTQAKFTGGGIAGRQIAIDETRVDVAAGVTPTPVPDVAYLVPSDPDEPRVAAETQAAEAASDEPLKVDVVNLPTSEPHETEAERVK